MKKQIFFIIIVLFIFLLACQPYFIKDVKPNTNELAERELIKESEVENITSRDSVKTPEEENEKKSVEEKTIPLNKPVSQPLKEKPLTFEQKVWKQRIDAAFGPSDCQLFSKPNFGESYKGKLIDTHYHIANIPDYLPENQEGDEEDEDDETEKREDEEDLILGENIRITDIICTLTQEGTEKVFAFFPVYPEIPKQMIEVAKKTMKTYPDKFVAFIMPPDSDNSRDGSPTVDAETLSSMLSVNPGLFKGYGEIGLYAREDGAAELPPDAQRLLDIYPVVKKHNLIVYFHLGEGHKDNFEKILKQNPNINFIWHGDQLIPYERGEQNLNNVDDILSNHPNVYYTIDELYGDVWMIRPDKTKEEFLTYLQDYENLLEKDLYTWKAIIEKHPDQFMWGTDRSDQVRWSHDPEVGQALSNYGRAFIARLDPLVQEKFAYKNAERLLR